MKFVAWLVLVFVAAGVRAQPSASQPRQTLAPLVEMLAGSDDPHFQLDILKGMSDGLKGRRTVKMPAGWEPVASKLRQSPSAKVRELAQDLSVMFGSATTLAALRNVLIDGGSPMPARTNALATLLQVKDPQLVRALYQIFDEPALRLAVLRGLAAYSDSGTPGVILSRYSSFNAAEKTVALTALSSRAPYARALLDAVAEGRVPARDLTADIIRQLRTLKDNAVNEQVGKAWGLSRETEAEKLQEIARLKTLLQDKGFGDARRGRAIYEKVCQQCHTLFGEGGKVGPELTGANRSDVEYMLQNIVDPNALIPNDYRTWNVETKDDRSITGIVTRQDDKTVTIVTATENITIPRQEVQSLKQTELSLMPEGLLQPLTESEVRDLLGYLRSTAQVPAARP